MVNVVHWLLPKEQKFFDMLKKQSSNVVEGSNQFKDLVYNYNKLSFSKKQELIKKIEDIEHKGDDLAHNIINILDKSFITPIDKEDIHRLVILLDDVIDLIYKTSGRILIFKLNRIDSHVKKLTEVAIEIIRKVDRGIVEVEFLSNMRQFYIDVHTLENKGDDIYHISLTKLFDKEDVVDIIKYKEIYELLESLIDKCEEIANVIESIVVKHA